jgi:uncharacterized protein YbjT (DUF2867 family)
LSILVTGATGTAGRDIVHELTRLKVPVRAMVRDPGKAAGVLGAGVELVPGDFTEPATFDAALKGQTALMLVVPPGLEVAKLGVPLVAAAKHAGVKRIVHFSALGAGQSAPSLLLKIQGELEAGVRESGIAWTILRPNFFMQNLLGSAGTIKKEGVYYSDFGEGAAAFVDTRDIGAVAARVLTEAGHEGKAYTVSGPQALTCHQVAETFTRILGKPVKYVDVPREAFARSLQGFGLPAPVATAVADLAGLVTSGEAAKLHDTVEKIGKKKPMTLEQFVRDHAAAFKG